MNPFRKTPSALKPNNKKDQERFIFPKKAWQTLDDLVSNEVNVLILGPEGSGKSTLLNFYFSDEQRRNAAKQGRLVFTADLSATDDSEQLFKHLLKQLQNAAKKYLPEEAVEAIEQAKTSAAENGDSLETTFTDACSALCDAGYNTLLVMDGFERFVSSPNIQMDQHEALRSLLDQDIMRCVVATNYDLEKSSLPPDVAGSLYLQKFQDKVILQGLDPRDALTFIERRLGADHPFSEPRLRFLMSYTGGVPHLFEAAASYMLDALEKEGSINPNALADTLFNAFDVTMERWCKFFSASDIALLRSAAEKLTVPNAICAIPVDISNSEEKGSATRLEERALWRKVEKEENVYSFNCILLQRFFMEQKDQILVTAPEAAEVIQDVIVEQSSKTEIHYHLEGASNVTIGDNANVTNNTLASMISTRDLVQMLTDSAGGREGFANLLYERFNKALPSGGMIEPPRPEGMTDEEYATVYDQAFNEQVSSKVVEDVAVDEDMELSEVTEQEQLTLESRFQEARTIRPELTDEILKKVSPRTRFYLLLSVIVEDALSILKLLHSKEKIDCSPQLILYGKALEQQLRDSFFSLFHRDATLKYATASEKHTFATVKEAKTTIGSYQNTILDYRTHLSTLCVTNQLTYGQNALTANQWEGFWIRLRNSLEAAREIRNRSAHSSKEECPGWEELDQLAQLCFGSGDESIFAKTTVGRDLCIVTGSGALSIFEGRALENTEAVFCCTKVKANGGMDGYLAENTCPAKISQSAANTYKAAHPETVFNVGDEIPVNLDEYKEQNGQLYFAATPL